MTELILERVYDSNDRYLGMVTIDIESLLGDAELAINPVKIPADRKGKPFIDWIASDIDDKLGYKKYLPTLATAAQTNPELKVAMIKAGLSPIPFS